MNTTNTMGTRSENGEPLRFLSLAGASLIGQGLTGSVYRAGSDTVVKIRHSENALEELKSERDLTLVASAHGIPTAVVNDIVITEKGYGAVYPLVDADTFSDLLAHDLSLLPELTERSASLLKTIHRTKVRQDEVPDRKALLLNTIRFSAAFLPDPAAKKALQLYSAIPETDTLIHGDFHFKNMLLQNGRAVLIDMDTLSTGHSVFEFSSMYKAYVGYGELDETNVTSYFGLPYDVTKRIYDDTLRRYFAGTDERTLETISQKIRLLSYLRLIRTWATERRYDEETRSRHLQYTKERILTLLSSVNDFQF